MKIKASWAAFVPVTVGAVLLHIYHLFFLGGDEITQTLFGEYSLLINSRTEPELIVILAAVLFLLSALFSLADRKTAPFCEITGDPLGGIFLILSGLLLGVDSSVNLMTILSNEAVSGVTVAKNVFGVVVALLFAVVGMGLLVGFNISKKIRLLMLLPTIWSAIGMISVFANHRKEAPSFAFYDVFSWVLLTLFLFHYSMVLCGIEIKNPVKSSFVYGLTYILFATVYVISSVNSSINELGYFEFTQLVPQFLIGSLALFTLFSLFSLSSKMITKKKAEELYGYEGDNGEKSDSKKKTKKDKDKEEEEDDTPEAAFGVGSTKYVTAEFEKIRLEKAAKKAKERTDRIIVTDDNFDEDEADEEPLSTLDKIDQLIMELSDDSNS